MEMSKEIPCVTVLNKQKHHFFFFYKIGEQEETTGPALRERVVTVGSGRRWERAWKNEYSRNIEYTCMQMKK
jgi:hypothetical protein